MTSILENSRRPDITFHANGRICIAARVAKALDLAHGDVIDIMVDKGGSSCQREQIGVHSGYAECSRGCGIAETYLYVKHRAPLIGRHEGMVFRSNKNGNHCIASSVRLCRFIITQSSATGSKVRLCCGDTVTLSHYGTALPIIFKHILS